MPTLTVRDVPPALREKLERQTERHRRSLNGEVLAVLEEATDVPEASAEEALENRRALIERIKERRRMERELP
jgi:plasmid stability protein